MRTLFTLLIASTLHAGEFNPTLKVGDGAPAWKDLDGVDGKKHALADITSDVVVVAFICNSCATAQAYEDRIIKFVADRCGKEKKTSLVAINVNTIKDDQLPKMTERAKKRKFNFAYLYDPSQEVAKAFGARYTPEFFVLDKARKIAYMGAMDDKSKAEDVKVQYLVPAVEAALASRPAEKAETAAFGCRIRYVQKK